MFLVSVPSRLKLVLEYLRVWEDTCQTVGIAIVLFVHPYTERGEFAMYLHALPQEVVK